MSALRLHALDGTTTKLRHFAFTIDESDEGAVERPAPGAAPTAFRIWRAGANQSDDGPVYFTRASASRLIAQQDARARVYSIDFDHLSLARDGRAAESGRAAGWHELELRGDANGEPELWAVKVDWCADVRAGLEEKPPRWRFFSPAFLTTKEGEITSYVNLALCINPLTHGIPSLAAASAEQKGNEKMDPEKCAATLDAMIAAESDEDKKAALVAARKAAYGDPESGEKKPEDGEGEKTAAEGEGEGDEGEKKKKPEESSHTHAAKTATSEADAATVRMAQENVAMAKRLEALEIADMLRARDDLPEATKAWCAKQPKKIVESFLKEAARSGPAKRNETPTQGDGTGATGLQGDELEYVNRGMRMHSLDPAMPKREADGTLVMRSVRPSQVREAAARDSASQKGKG